MEPKNTTRMTQSNDLEQENARLRAELEALKAGQPRAPRQPTGLTADGRPKTIKLEAVMEVFYDGDRYLPGKQFLCDEESAVELTRSFEGVYAFSGERSNNDAPLGKIIRARKVS